MATVYILNVWDETQGKYVGIPAIKGDKGDKGDTPVIPIANETVLGLVTPAAKTDDMIEEVGVDTNGKLWIRKIPEVPELILSTTLPERVKSATFTTDNDGNIFELKYMELEIVFPARVSNTTSDYYWDHLNIIFSGITVNIDGTKFLGKSSVGPFKEPANTFIIGNVQGGVVTSIANRDINKSGTNACTSNATLTTNISSLEISIDSVAGSDAYVPKDTKITLRGIRA